MYALIYLIPVLPVSVGLGLWLRDEPDYRDAPGMLGVCAFMGGLIWPLVIVGAIIVGISTLFGFWLQEYGR